MTLEQIIDHAEHCLNDFETERKHNFGQQIITRYKFKEDINDIKEKGEEND